MQNMWSWLAVNLGRKAGLVTTIGLLLTVALGYGITNLDFATGQDSYLNSGDQVFKDNVTYQDLFGGQAMLSVISMDDDHFVDELFTSEGIATFDEVGDTLRADDGVLNVIDPVAAVQLAHNLVTSEDGNPFNAVATQALQHAAEVAVEEGDEASAAAREANLAKAADELLSAGADGQELTNPEWVRFLLYEEQFPEGGGVIRKSLRPFFSDDSHALSLVRLQGNQSIEEEGSTADLVVAQSEKLTFPNSTTTTTGAPVLLQDINDYLRGGMLTLGGAALLAMAVILILFFRFRWRLLPLAVVTVGVIWAFGMVGYIGVPLTLVTIAALPVMLGVGIDYAVQMQSRIEEEVIIDRTPHPIQEAARQLGNPLLVVTANSVLAFLAILAAKTPMIRQFGLLLAIGIVAICISSIVNPLAILGMREYRSPTKGKSWVDGPMATFVNKLGSLPSALGAFLLVGALAVFALGAFYDSELEIQTDPVRWVNQDTQIIEDLHTLDEEIGGANEMGVYVVDTEGDSLFTDESVEYVDRVTNETLAEYDQRLLVGSSIIAAVSDLTDVEGAEHVAPLGDHIDQAWNVAPEDIQVSTMSADADAMNVIFLAAKGSLEDRAPIVDDINGRTDQPEDVRITPSGLAVVGVGLLENLTDGRVFLTYLALALVFVWLTIAFRSVVRSGLAMVPVMIAVGVASLVAYFGGFKLSPMTAVGGPLVVAVCTEFTTLILYRYLEERRRGLEPRAAMDMAGARTGRAFVVSALTTLAGVAVIALSSLPLLRDFGITVALNVTVALLSALIILPPIVIWADKRNWVSKGMMERKEVPYIKTPDYVGPPQQES